MTDLKGRLQSDLTDAMRAKDELRMATLRMALAAISNEEVAGASARTLSDDEVVSVLAKEAKKRREAATAYDDASRPELADRERAELGVLEGYLPEALSDEDLAAMIDAAVAEAAASGHTGMKAMGAVMKVLTPQVRGRADGSVVAAQVKERLAAG